MRQLKITKSITNRESDSLDKYLQEIGHEELISVEEEVELAQRIKKGDRKALEKLTKSQLAVCCVCCQTVPKPRAKPARPHQRGQCGLDKKLPKNSTRPAVSSSFRMLYGGLGKASCRPLPSKAALFACH